MSKLILCEKPSQARDIARNIGATKSHEGYIDGNNYIVTWCLGHLLELAPPEHYNNDIKPWRLEALPIEPEYWKLIPNKKTNKQLNIIKKLLKEVNHVIIATDADREGDLIGREVLGYFKFNGDIERLWLSALDDASIKQAFENIKPDNFSRDLYQAGLGRQRADWLIGMNMTMGTTVRFSQGSGVLSVGRVQSPTLKLIVDRDYEIDHFKSKDYYDLIITVTNFEKSFAAKWIPSEKQSDESGRCLQYGNAETAMLKVKDNLVKVIKYNEHEKEQKPPLGLSLSALQKLCSSKFGFSAKETLQLAQSLYETHKAITYPRTDCQYLPLNQFDDAKTIIDIIAKQGSCYVDIIEICDLTMTTNIWNDKKITAHHAIIPTLNAHISIEDMNDKEKKIYDLISRYYLAQFLGNYRYFQKEVELICSKEHFKASSHTPKYLGWKLALKSSPEEAEDKEDEVQDIPFMEINDKLKCVNAEIETKQTKPPARFTEGSLISAMKSIAKYLNYEKLKKILKEAAGIGTEATRANIIETLLNRGYIERKKKQIISTSKGKELIALLPSIVADPTLTANWESYLDNIAQGKSTLNSFIESQSHLLKEMLEAIAKHEKTTIGINDSEYRCQKCQGVLIRRKGKFGYFWGCMNYPECKEIYKDNKGKPFLDKNKYPCPKCSNGFLQLRTSKKGKFWGCSNFPDCKVIMGNKGGKPVLDDN